MFDKFWLGRRFLKIETADVEGVYPQICCCGISFEKRQARRTEVKGLDTRIINRYLTKKGLFHL